MTRAALLIGIVLLTAGCRQEVKIGGLTGHDLHMAYDRCMGSITNHDNNELRIACTAAVYGGRTP